MRPPGKGTAVWAAIPMIGYIYVLFRPVSNGQILLPVLVALCVCGFAAGILGRHRIAVPLVLFLLVQISFGLIFAFVGRDNPGVGDQMVTFLGFPILYWLMVYGLSEQTLGRLVSATAIGCIIVSVTIILYIGSQQGPLPEIIPSSFLQSQTDAFFTSGGGGGGGRAVRFYGLATLAAGTPIWVASILVPNAKLLPSMRVRLIAAITCTVAALVAGRQAILLTTILAPVFLLVASKVIGRSLADRSVLSRLQLRRARRLRFSLVLAMLVGILVIGGLSFNSSAISGTEVSKAFGSVGSTYLGTGGATDPDNVVRQEESDVLLTGFRAHPLLGSGLGATFPDYRRDDDKPWDFELQYHMLLFDSGLVGVVFALSAVVLVIYAARRAVVARPDLAGCLAVTTVGCLAMLAAAASNPYLQAPGYNWALYLPLAVINVALTCQSRSLAPPIELVGAGAP